MGNKVTKGPFEVINSVIKLTNRIVKVTNWSFRVINVSIEGNYSFITVINGVIRVIT